MTVPAFSVSAVLPGAPIPPTGTGAAASAPAGGLFESLLTGFGEPSTAGRAARSGAGTSEADPLAPETRDWVQDAGLTVLTPFTAPALAVTPAPDAEGAAPAVAASRQGRLSSLFADRINPAAAPVAANDGVEAGFAPSTAASEPDANPATPDAPTPARSPVSFTPGSIAAPSSAAPALAEVAPTPAAPIIASPPAPAPVRPVPVGAQTADLAGLAATVQDPSPDALIDAAPLPSEARPPVGRQAPTQERAGIQPPDQAQVQVQVQAGPRTQAAVATQGPASTPPPSDALAPPLAATPATNPAAVATASTVESLTTTAVAPPSSRPASPPEGDLRRPTATRGDHRRAEGAARTAAAPASGPVTRDTALATAAERLSAAAVADPDEPAAGSVAEVDLAETPDVRVPALPSELRAQAVQDADLPAETVANRASAETVARLAADIVRKADGQSTRFDLELNPHGLGKVDVALEIDRNGKLTAALSFDSAQSAADLRGRAGELRLALEQAGFDVAEGGLTFDLSGQGAGFSGREAGQQQDRAWNGRAFQRAQLGADEADLSLASTPSTLTPWTRSGVDIRI